MTTGLSEKPAVQANTASKPPQASCRVTRTSLEVWVSPLALCSVLLDWAAAGAGRDGEAQRGDPARRRVVAEVVQAHRLVGAVGPVGRVEQQAAGILGHPPAVNVAALPSHPQALNPGPRIDLGGCAGVFHEEGVSLVVHAGHPAHLRVSGEQAPSRQGVDAKLKAVPAPFRLGRHDQPSARYQGVGLLPRRDGARADDLPAAQQPDLAGVDPGPVGGCRASSQRRAPRRGPDEKGGNPRGETSAHHAPSLPGGPNPFLPQNLPILGAAHDDGER